MSDVKELEQSLFDRVVIALRRQGGPSFGTMSGSSGPTCLYREKRPDGTVRKCAAGHLIPDEVYSPDMEGKLIDDSFNDDLLGRRSIRAVLGEHTFLVDHLQRAHDEACARDFYLEEVLRTPDDVWLKHFIESAKRIASDRDISDEALYRPLD